MASILSQPAPEGGSIHVNDRLRNTDFIMDGHHCHNTFELYYVESGSCRFIIDDHFFDLHPGDMILIPPRVLHYTRYLTGTCRRIITFFRSQDLPEKLTRQMPMGPDFFSTTRIFHVPEHHMAQVLHCFSRMVTEEKIQDPRSPLLLSLILQELLLICARLCTFYDDLPTDIHTTDPLILQAASFIHDHYMQPITTGDIAAAVGFSPNYLSRRFRQSTGIGPHEYLVFVRLRHAALELISTPDSIITIALRCGFSDSNYFKDSFKKKFGVTPRAYRRSG